MMILLRLRRWSLILIASSSLSPFQVPAPDPILVFVPPVNSPTLPAFNLPTNVRFAQPEVTATPRDWWSRLNSVIQVQ